MFVKVRFFACIALTVSSAPWLPAQAEEARREPVQLFGDVRLRSEAIERTNSAGQSWLLSASARVGLEAPLTDALTALLELEGVSPFVLETRSSARQASERAGVEVNRAQLSVDAGALDLVLGRQTIAWDNERFVGAVAFRQNHQSFDAISARYSADNWALEASQFWRVNQVDAFSTDRPRVSGEGTLARLSSKTPIGWFSVYALQLKLSDKNDALAGNSTTAGISLEERWPIGAATLNLRFDFAEQIKRDHAGNSASPNYWLARVSLESDRLGLTLGREVFGTDRGTALEAPLGSKRAFQGFAGVFASTPPSGVADTHLELRLVAGNFAPVSNATAFVRAHIFESSSGERVLGSELDAGVAATIGAHRLSLEIANYESRGFGSDTRAAWLTVSRRF